MYPDSPAGGPLGAATAHPHAPAARAGLRPLAELPAAALRPLHGVMTDIDDTLTHDGTIAPAALAALQALADAGVPVLPITGRPAGWSRPFVRQWPVPAIVAENGGVLLQREGVGQGVGEGTGVAQHFTVDEATRAARHARLQACAAAVLAQVPGARLAQDSPGRLTDIAVDHSEFAHLDAAQIDAVLAVMRAHGLTATVSSIHINGWLGTHNKPSGAAWAVTQVLGQAFVPGQWLYVGDSTNDQAMFATVPLSVGVANIARFVPQLRVLPAYVTPAERGQGFAQVAAALLAARG
ncbi:MAG: HAD family hydrolase [Burkholderiales bacterium PBB5]|nr:MAG: HAD family hydrolase [Burkholderiales bacterium PBB5]